MELLIYGYKSVEGPTIDERGGLYFCDVLGGGVHHLLPDGTTETVIPNRRYVGGLARHADGGLVVSGRDVIHWREDVTRAVLTAADLPAGTAPVVGFGDMFADSEGRLYVGAVRRYPDRSTAEGEFGLLVQAHEPRIGYADVELSNGIAASPDGHRLYHADTGRRRINVSVVATDGSICRKVVFSTAEVAGKPDGLAVDREGGIWVAFLEGGCVARFEPDGQLGRIVPVPAASVLSVCFMGTRLETLVVTTMDNTQRPELGGCAFAVDVGVAGTPVGAARV